MFTIKGYFLPSTTSIEPTSPPSPSRSLRGTHSGRGSDWNPSTASPGTGLVELVLIFNCSKAEAYNENDQETGMLLLLCPNKEIYFTIGGIS